MSTSPFPLWSLHEQVFVRGNGDGLWVQGLWNAVHFRQPTPVVREALHRMELGPVRLANIAPAPTARAELHAALRRIQAMVVLSLGTESLRGPLLSVVPVDPRANIRVLYFSPKTTVQLATTATLHPMGSEFVLESPLSFHRVVCHWPEVVYVLAMFSAPNSGADVVAEAPLSQPEVMSILGYVRGAGMLRLSGEGIVAPTWSGPPTWSRPPT